jgi:hypothetical protein
MKTTKTGRCDGAAGRPSQTVIRAHFIFLGCVGLVGLLCATTAAQSSVGCVPFQGSPATSGKCDPVVTYSNVYVAYVSLFRSLPLFAFFVLYLAHATPFALLSWPVGSPTLFIFRFLPYLFVLFETVKSVKN